MSKQLESSDIANKVKVALQQSSVTLQQQKCSNSNEIKHFNGNTVNKHLNNSIQWSFLLLF